MKGSRAPQDGVIDAWLAGDYPRPPTIVDPATPIRRSHACAAEHLQRVYETNGVINDDLIYSLVLDLRGWWESTTLQLEGGRVSRGGGLYMSYVFPAVRLALVAIALKGGVRDPVARIMVERAQVSALCKEHGWVMHDHSYQADPSTDEHVRNALMRAATAFRDQTARTPRDEGLWGRYGSVLVRLGKVAEAEEALRYCLALPWCRKEDKASALYNLACVYARASREDNCRDALERSVDLQSCSRQWLMADADFQSVREKPWFQRVAERCAP